MDSNIISQPQINPMSDISGSLEARSHWMEKLQKLVTRKEVAEKNISLHHTALQRTKQISLFTQAIENKTFQEPEFLFFVDIKKELMLGGGSYQGFQDSLRLFQVAIEAKNSFLMIEQIELIYRSSCQQEFYQLIFDLLEQSVTTQEFYRQVHQKLKEVMPKVRTEKGKRAVLSYVKALDTLSKQDKLGLQLLYLFKKYQLSDYSILKNVSDMLIYLKNKNLKDLKLLTRLVTRNYPIFEKLGKIIGISAEQSTPKTYALILQYLALSNKYQKSYRQFETMLLILKDWEKNYQHILEIRQEHSIFQYKCPSEFKDKVAGQEIYQKYKGYLSS